MTETIHDGTEAADILHRIMAEMEDVFGLINRPRRGGPATEPAAEPVPAEERLLAA